VAAIGVISLLIIVMGWFPEMPDILGFGLRGGSGVLWFWFYLAILFGALATMVWGFFRNVAGVQNLIPLVYMVPGIGPAIQTITIARFCWTISLTLGSGLDPMRSIRLALDSTDSDYYRNAADDAENAIRGGASLSGALQATNLFPDDLLQRIEIAEHSGTDAESIDYMTQEYDERAKRAVKVIAGIVTLIIWLSVMILIIFFIFRLFGTYLNALNTAGAPI
jgi:type II secretory pathway component PulF